VQTKIHMSSVDLICVVFFLLFFNHNKKLSFQQGPKRVINLEVFFGTLKVQRLSTNGA